MAFLLMIPFLLDGKSKSQQTEIKQSIMNNINVNVIANTVVKTLDSTNVSNTTYQDVTITLDNCQIGGDFDITQLSGISADIYTVTKNDITQTMISDIQSQIQSQLSASLEQVNKKLFDLFSKQQSAKVDQDIVNSLNNTLSSSVTVNNVTQLFADSFVKQTLTIPCTNSVIGGDFNVTQQAQIDMVVTKLVNNTIDNLAQNKLALDWVNTEGAKVKQELTDIFGEIGDFLKKFGLYIAIAIGLAIIGFVALVIILKMRKSNQQPQMMPPPGYPMRPQPQMMVKR